jgi:alpha-L-rhamnosidase
VQLNAKTAGDRNVTLHSDRTWRCGTSSSENTGKVKGHDNGGELIDARKYVPDWNAVGFDDSAWKPAAETALDLELSAHMLEPARFIEAIPAKSVTADGPVYKVDMGKNFTGFLDIKLKGLSAGDEVTIQMNDDANTPQDSGQRCVFISNGGDGEVFRNRFNFIAGRYLTLTGLKTAPPPADITGHALSTDVKRAGHFTSSSDLFNRIYETDMWTWRANLIEGFTMDCPHRERLGYGEVAFACAWGIALPNYETGALWTKQVRDWSDVQEESGRIPPIAPQINDFSFGGPMWSSAGLNVAWSFYQHYGDERILALTYPSSKRWLEFLHSHSADGLLQRYDMHPGKFLGDWAAPGPRNERGDSPQALFFNNCVYAMNLENFIEIARILDKPDDVTLCRQRLAELKKNIHAKWFDPKKKRYMAGTHVQYAFAEFTGESPYGAVRSRWERSGDQLKLLITVPPNSQATVHIPTTQPDSLTEGGKPIAEVEGITPLKPGSGQAVMKVAAGRYGFSCRIN